MWPAALARLLRRRMLYVVLTILTFVYILLQLLAKNSAWRNFQYGELRVERTRPLIWRTLQENVKYSQAASVDSDDELTNLTTVADEKCRNSVQGRDLIVDDRGFVCIPNIVQHNGCCDLNVPLVTSYDCQTCNTTSHCCGIYEYCVSCCLHPDKRPLLELVLSQIRGRQALVFASVADQFELCLVKCRTSSHSVQHENRYRDVHTKYCYGHTTAHESEIEVLGGIAPAD